MKRKSQTKITQHDDDDDDVLQRMTEVGEHMQGTATAPAGCYFRDGQRQIGQIYADLLKLPSLVDTRANVIISVQKVTFGSSRL